MARKAENMQSNAARLNRIEAWTRDLCLIPGLSGYEDPVSAYIAAAFAGTRAENHVDALGNLTLTVPGTDPKAPKIMIFAHTDQMGLMVRRIEPDGFVRVERLGGVPDRILPGLRVVIMNRRGEQVPAIVGLKAHHATPPDEKFKVVPCEQLYLDLGVTSADAVRALGVEIGAPVTYQPEFRRIADTRIVGTALDDRAGCAVLMELVQAVLDRPVPATLQAVFSVQEEFNLRGAMLAAERLRPDAAVSIDIMIASDTPDLAQRGELRLGAGPALGLYSFHGRGTLNGTLAHPALLNHLAATGADAKIPLQRSAHTGCLTDSSYVQLVGEGIPSIDIGYPTRYTHSPIEMCDLADLEGIALLLEAALGAMKGGFSFARQRYE
jgi:putative aminopeptidase FrvX